jgi:hypothetical protein
MRFLRHFAAVLAVVAVVVLAGVAWNHFWPGTLIGREATGGPRVFARGVPGLHLKGPPPGRLPAHPGHVAYLIGHGGHIVRLNSGPGVSAFYGLLKIPNLEVLRHTAYIEAVVIAAVIVADAARRRIRRARRKARLGWQADQKEVAA